MNTPGEQWRREDCFVEKLSDHDSYRVLHMPSKTEILVDRLRVEMELQRNIDLDPMEGTREERREAIAVRFAWEEATGGKA